MVTRHARGLLATGEVWRQESITGGLFSGWLERSPNGDLVPHIRGRAFVTAEAVLRFDPDDPFRVGFAP
jgi:4-hydroxyproline epimerase